MRFLLADLRNRLLIKPRFRAFFGRIWPFRLIARRRARQLFDISAGFVYSKTLMACLELNWFEMLRGGPRSIDDMASAAGMPASTAKRLLLAASALDLLEPRADGEFALGPLGAALIGDESIAAMARHHRMFYDDMRDPVGLLKDNSDTALSRYWAYATSDDPASLGSEAVREYSELMASSQPMIAEQVLAAFEFPHAGLLVDLGGGTGAFLSHVHARYPSLKKTLFDLPGVVASVDRPGIDVQGCSFLDADLPEDATMFSLVRIIHDHDDDTVATLLSNIRRCISPGSHLLIAEPLAATRGAETVGHAYFGFYLWAMGSGRARTQAEIDGLLEAAGFAPTKEYKTPVPLVCSVLLTHPV